jgi:uncharacterized membrane protein
MIQFRLGEMLLILPFINKKYSISLIIGVFIVNFFSPLGLIDVVVGTSSTALMCFFITRVKQQWLVPVIAAILTGTMIGLMLYVVLDLNEGLALIMLYVGIGQFLSVTLGLIIFSYLKRNHASVYQMLENI